MNSMVKWKNKYYFCQFLFIICWFFVFLDTNINICFSKEIISSKFDNIVIPVAAPTPYPPYTLVDKNKKVYGADIEILDEISKRTGIKFQINNLDTQQVIASLEVNKNQLSVSCWGYTQERTKSVNFSKPYYFDEGAMATIASYSGATKIVDLVGQKIALEAGSVQYSAVVEYNKTAKDGEKIDMKNVVLVNDEATAMQFLQNRKVDAIITSGSLSDGFKALSANKDIKTAPAEGLASDESSGCFLLFSKQMDTDVNKAINNALEDMIANGETDGIIKKWEKKYKDEIAKKADDIKQGQNAYNKALISITKGIPMALVLTFCSVFFGTIISILLVAMRYSKIKVLSIFSKCYISVIRGLPILLQMSVVFFILPTLLKIEISVFTAGVISLSFCSAAYLAEIIRSGINAIDKEQFEACKSLNMSKIQMIKDVIAPQVFINTLPAFINEISAIIKDTSLLSGYGAYEIMKRSSLVTADYYTYFAPLLVAGLSYYVLTFSLERLARFFEKGKKY